MKRIYITMGGQGYDALTEIAFPQGKALGADDVLVYDDVWVRATEFYHRHEWLFTNFERNWGFGYNCWKPYIIMDALSRYDPNEDAVVLYVDGDTYPINRLDVIWNTAQRDGVMCFAAQGCPNKRFTRRDCFRAMGMDTEQYWDAPHACGRFSAWRGGSALARMMLMEWFTYSVNRNCQGWLPSAQSTDFPEFARHSAEQSVLTNLCAKYRVPLHREACQFGWPPSPGQGQPEDSYPQLFIQDGRRDADQGLGSRFRNV